MKRFGKMTLSLLLAGSLTGCFAGNNDDIDQQQQLLRGHVPLSQYSADIVGVRVVSGGQAVASAKTDAQGNFNIYVPHGEDYTFEIVTKTGSHTLLAGPLNGPSPTTFDVCDPGEDFDLGDLNPFDFEEVDGDEVPWSDHEEECVPPPWICGDGPESGEPCWEEPLPCDAPEANPEFCWIDPLPCEESTSDPAFCWDTPPCDALDDPYCGEKPPPPHPCDDPSGFGCEEPPLPPPFPCDDPSGVGCEEPPLPPPFPCDDPSGIGCEEPPLPPDFCQAPSGVDCEEPPFPCDDPNGVDCEEPPLPPPFPCDDPSGFGCEEPPFPCDSSEDTTCWPEPDICIITPEGDFIDCDDTGAAPEFPLPDFGCE